MAKHSSLTAFTTKHLHFFFVTPKTNLIPTQTSTTLNHKTTRCYTTLTLSSAAHPSLDVIGGAVDMFLSAFTTLDRPYATYPLVGSNTHVETIFAYLFRTTPDVRFRRECLRMKDNGTVALDWVSGDHTTLPPNSPPSFCW